MRLLPISPKNREGRAREVPVIIAIQLEPGRRRPGRRDHHSYGGNGACEATQGETWTIVGLRTIMGVDLRVSA